MAKRKRLEPARLEGAHPDGAPPPPVETKSMFPAYPSALAPSGLTPARRSPIADVAADVATVAALQDLTQSLTAARSEGRLIQRLPLSEIDAAYLVRDRIGLDPEELASLSASLRLRGQQTAIEVADLGEGRPGGRWGLISGWRRLCALRQLQRLQGGTDTVLAIIRAPREAADAYLAMIEENEIRVGLSYYERARIVARAADQGVYPHDRAGLAALFSSASRSKRSKIGSFLRIVRTLDDDLRFPAALNERLGLALAVALDADPALAPRLQAALTAAAPATPAAEAVVIQRALRPATASDHDHGRAGPDGADVPESSVESGAESETDSVSAPSAPLDRGQGFDIVSGLSGTLVLTGPLIADRQFVEALRQWMHDYVAAQRDR
jgi:ParB family transcriptional regulator, chromosome partitioning protein